MTAPAQPTRIGIRGRAFRLPLVDPRGTEMLPETAAVLEEWIINLADTVPPDILVSCAHLRPVPGQMLPPARSSVKASHEFMILALRPEYAPWDYIKADLVLRQGHRLSFPEHVPPYSPQAALVGLHLQDLKDQVAKSLVALAVNAILDGALTLNDPPYRQHARWSGALESAARQLQAGKRVVALDVPAAVAHG